MTRSHEGLYSINAWNKSNQKSAITEPGWLLFPFIVHISVYVLQKLTESYKALYVQ